MIHRYEGDHLDILYEADGAVAVVRAIEPHPQTYLRPGSDHLISDIRAFMRDLSGRGVPVVTAIPDRSATRLALEEAGFRGDRVMSFSPASPDPCPVLDAGRPGAFGPDTLILLEDGQTVPAGALHPGLRVTDGGRIDEVMLARVRRICRFEGAVFGVLNRVLIARGPRLVTEMPSAEVEETPGTDMIFLVTQRSRVRSGGLLFEDMWGSAQMRQARRISQDEVIAALNASESANAGPARP